MPRRSSKHRDPRKDVRQPMADIPTDRPGLPAAESIQSVEKFVSPQHEVYQIIHTTETDEYDRPPKPKNSRPRRETGPGP